MNTEIYIENYRLDVYKDISALLNFAIDDIKDFSSRSTTWSKTIVLPGTANNNKLFGHIFELGQANAYDSSLPNVAYNFNASKGADCIIFQDNLQTFKGVLRLLEIISDNGVFEYEVAVFGEISALNVSLSSGLLEDLDFSAYDHDYTVANIVSSWDNTPGSGYCYPLIDYGNYSELKKNWKVGTFRPALYAKEYIDKMFEDAGFRFESDLFETDRFKRLVIPSNKKELLQLNSPSLSATRATSYVALTTSQGNNFIRFVTVNEYGFTANANKNIFTYDLVETLIFNGTATLSGTYTRDGAHGARTVRVDFQVNTTVVATTSFTTLGSQTDTPWSVSLSPTNFTLNENDTITILFTKVGSTDPTSTYNISVSLANLLVNTDATTYIPLELGNPLLVNETIPKGIRQVDFLVSLVKLFNLYVYEDKFDNRLIYIKPYIDFHSSTDIVNWTYKLNRNKPVRIKPMSELNAKIYEFKFKPDSDYYNDLYKKRYGQNYGDFIFDSEYEFAEQKNSLELIFSSTPLVGYLGEDKIYSTIFKRTGNVIGVGEEPTDSNIRILQTKKITGVDSWNIQNSLGTTTLSTQTSYLYAGHLNNPDAPGDDLNFGAPEELFFVLTAGDLSVNQFNVYWSEYMADITDKDSKLLTASFRLTSKDIFDLDFSKYIHIDGITFRLNKIENYNASNPDDCIAELLKVSYSPAGSEIDFYLWSQDGDNYVDDGSGNDIEILE